MEGGISQEAAAAYTHAGQAPAGDATSGGGTLAQSSTSPAPHPQYDYSTQQWQAHDPAWQQYYQQQHQQQQQHQPAPAQQPQYQHSSAAPAVMPPDQQGQLPQQQPSATPPHAGTPPHGGTANGVGVWPQQPPTPDPTWQQAAAAEAQQHDGAPLPPLPSEDAPPMPDATPSAPPRPPEDATEQYQQQQPQQPHNQWPQQQWQQQWPPDSQSQQRHFWQQQGYPQQAWDGSYTAANGAYHYPQQYQQQWPQLQPYQQPAGYAHAYPPQQQPQQQGVYTAWPSVSMPYAAHQAPQQVQVPYSAPAAWQPSAAGYPAATPSAVASAPQQQHHPQPQPRPQQPPQGPPLTTAAALFQSPGREARPLRIVVLLRGPPGSGKTAAARAIRAAEQAAGASVRVHSIDDYFVTEVEKEVDDEKRAGRKRKVTEMEYLYEAELEDSYEASLLKAYTRTVDEGRFQCVLVDAPLPRAAQLREYWRLGQKAGYEVYISLPLETDPEVCHKRNVHNRSLDDIRKAVAAMEPPQPSFPQVDLSGLFGPPPADSAAQPSAAAAGHPAASNGPQQRPPAASIDEVDMDADSDEERTPASKDAGGGKHDGGERGGASSDDDDAAAAVLLGGSRWGSMEDAGDDEVTPHKRKRRKQQAAAAEEDEDAFRTPAPTKKSGAALRGILSTGGTGSAQRVRWADEGADESAGFLVGGASREQLETVFVLEGLGPPMDEEQRQALSSRNFEDQVKGEHNSEHRLFRDHMLGGGSGRRV